MFGYFSFVYSLVIATAKVLLKEAGTNECQPANQKLSSLRELDLSRNQISDITPLTSLTNLTFLDLSDNRISDITPLKSLTNLTLLNLNANQISNITPLTSLTNLKQFHVWDNPIANKTCPLKPESICKFSWF